MYFYLKVYWSIFWRVWASELSQDEKSEKSSIALVRVSFGLTEFVWNSTLQFLRTTDQLFTIKLSGHRLNACVAVIVLWFFKRNKFLIKYYWMHSKYQFSFLIREFWGLHLCRNLATATYLYANAHVQHNQLCLTS